jgi:hypothetical protein
MIKGGRLDGTAAPASVIAVQRRLEDLKRRYRGGTQGSRRRPTDATASSDTKWVTPQRLAVSRPPRETFDLIFEDSQLNVHAGEREVRPPGAPTM